MSPADNNSAANPDDETPAVAALQDFEEDVSPEFVPRLRRRLHRRVFSGQVASFSYNVPAMLLREFLQLIFGLFLPASRDQRSSDSSSSRKENQP